MHPPHATRACNPQAPPAPRKLLTAIGSLVSCRHGKDWFAGTVSKFNKRKTLMTVKFDDAEYPVTTNMGTWWRVVEGMPQPKICSACGDLGHMAEECKA